MSLPLALPLFNLVPLYVYFYVLGCFWIRLDLIFCIVCVLIFSILDLRLLRYMVEIGFVV